LRSLVDPSFRGARTADFTFVPLKKAEVMALIARARIVVDVERSVQTGLTIRTIEMLGASRKLITTNASIAKADFYCRENVCVIDRNSPVLDEAFMATAYAPVDQTILARYSLAGWLDEVLPRS
jgi:hypothetical protein